MQKHLHNFKDRELLSMPLVEYFNLGASKIEVKQNRILLLATILTPGASFHSSSRMGAGRREPAPEQLPRGVNKIQDVIPALIIVPSTVSQQ